MQLGASIPLLYAQWLKDGLHVILHFSGQGVALPWDKATDMLKETLWEMEGLLRSSSYDGDETVLFYALFQRLCSQKFGTKGVFTLDAYPSDQQQATLLAEVLQERPSVVVETTPVFSWKRRLSRMGFFLLLMYLAGTTLLGVYFYFDHQRNVAELVEKEKAYQTLLGDYEKVYDAYYQLETKFVQLSKRPYRKFILSDTTRRIGADVHWFADEGEVMLNIDSLPPLDSGFSYVVFARTARETKPIGSFDQPLKMFEMGDFDPVTAPVGFIIKKVKGDLEEMVLSSK